MKKSYKMQTMPYANAHVEIDWDDIGYVKQVKLVSYSTTILVCKPFQNGVDVEVKYPVSCSASTRRHVNRFTTEFLCENKYFDLKKLEEGQHVFYNMVTGFYDMVREYRYEGKAW